MNLKRSFAAIFLCAVSVSAAASAAGCAAKPEAALAVNGSSKPEATHVQRDDGNQEEPVKSPLPPPDGYVNDFAGVIAAKTKQQLEERLVQLKKRANVEMVVATVETTGDTPIFEYSLAVARGWGIGPPKDEEGGGLLLLLAVKDRKWQIQVSRKLEADIPNDVAAEIGRSMTPLLRAGDYGAAITKCVDGLIKRLAERRGFTMDDKLELKTRTENKAPAKRRKP